MNGDEDVRSCDAARDIRAYSSSQVDIDVILGLAREIEASDYCSEG